MKDVLWGFIVGGFLLTICNASYTPSHPNQPQFLYTDGR